MLTVILVLFVVLIVAGFPRWPYSQNWGYGPSGVGGILLVIFVVWLLFFGGLHRLHF